MIPYSIIKKSQLEGALRLDAEYYSPYYFYLEKKIKKKRWDYLKNLIIFNRRGIQPKYSEEPTKYRAVVSQNILEKFLDVDSLPYVTEDFFNSTPAQKVKIRPYDILIYTTGANIGRTNIFYSKGIEAIASNHVNIIRVNPSKINQLYLGLFLQSKIGRDWTDRWASGSDQEEIYPEDFEKFPVLIPEDSIQKYCEETLIKCFALIEESNKIYSQAENLLLEELGLKDFKVEEDLSYIVNLSQIKSAHRADAEYFQPKYEKIFDFIKCPIKKLGEIIKFLNHAKQPPYIDNGEIPIITQKHLGKAFLNLEAINDPDTKFTSADWLKKYSKYKLKPGDVLYYSVGAYIGKTNIVLDNLTATAASFITIIRPTEEVDPIYLTVVLNSTVGQLQSEKWQSATAQQYIYPKDIKNFKIPILPKPTQQKIADLVQKSHEARTKAKQLLEKAKQKVEELIEK